MLLRPFSRWINWGTESLSNGTSFTQGVSVRKKIQSFLTPTFLFWEGKNILVINIYNCKETCQFWDQLQSTTIMKHASLGILLQAQSSEQVYGITACLVLIDVRTILKIDESWALRFGSIISVPFALLGCQKVDWKLPYPARWKFLFQGKSGQCLLGSTPPSPVEKDKKHMKQHAAFHFSQPMYWAQELVINWRRLEVMEQLQSNREKGQAHRRWNHAVLHWPNQRCCG